MERGLKGKSPQPAGGVGPTGGSVPEYTIRPRSAIGWFSPQNFAARLLLAA